MITPSTVDWFQSNTINIEFLPNQVKQQLLDYYQFLLSKYAPHKEKETSKQAFFESVKRHKYSLPAQYQFDRDWANER